ncbi:MAG TPA: response regulator [Actinomycetota bacterium]|nr:response regulator [Actinomycetota bacterium]
MLKVLIVEDDRNVAALVRHLLEQEGFVSSFSVDIEGAWGSLSGEPPDAAIIDLGLLGGESGWDLIERIRKDDRYATLPVVILTASPPEDVLDRARSLNCEYLGKPFSAPALLDRLQLAVRAAGRAPGQRMEQVVLILGGYRVEGQVHVPVELTRFSDAWEAVVRDAREFLPVTDAKMFSTDGTMIVNAAFLQVRKKDVRAAFTAESSRALEA